MYSEHVLSSEYYSDIATISGTDPKIRKEMNDYLAQKRENESNYQNDFLLQSVVFDFWLTVVLFILVCCLSAWSLFLLFK